MNLTHNISTNNGPISITGTAGGQDGRLSSSGTVLSGFVPSATAVIQQPDTYLYRVQRRSGTAHEHHCQRQYGTPVGVFSRTSAPAARLASGWLTTFNVALDPASDGLQTSTVTVTAAGVPESPYSFALQGVGTGPTIVIEQPVGSALTSGVSTVDLGTGDLVEVSGTDHPVLSLTAAQWRQRHGRWRYGHGHQ